jgi:HEAT repeat protein
MWLFPSKLLVILTALNPLKEEIQRHISLEGFEEAAKLAENLQHHEDPEGLYLSISAFAQSGNTSKALEILDKNKSYLKEHNFYNKALEPLALSLFKSHFNSNQEPIKMAALAALSQESDARVLDLLLNAFEHPNVKIKMMALRGLSGFADEKVKKTLYEAFKQTIHPAIGMQIAKLFGHWHDKRLLPLLLQKLKEDSMLLEEKINYILIIKELDHEISVEKIKSLASSPQASERLLATYLLSSPKVNCDNKILIKLLKDNHLWVKQSALITTIKRKINNSSIDKIVRGWKEDKSFELTKAYYYYGLINNSQEIVQAFVEAFNTGPIQVKRVLASILYSAGTHHEKIIEKLLDENNDPYLKLQLGLHLLSGEKYKKGIDSVKSALEQLKNKKIYIVNESVLPFFVIEDEHNSLHVISAGQRRAMDKHFRLQIFHLLAIKKMPEAKEVLKELLKSDLFEISLDAMVHFWENFGYDDKDYLATLLEDHDPELRLKAALVLNYLDYNKDIRKFLMESYQKQTYSMQIQILFSLSKYHEEDVIDFYVKNLKSKYPLIQAITAGCLFTSLYK